METLLTGLRISSEIVTVLWGALVFIRVLDQTGKTEDLNSWLQRFHPNKDMQVFLLSRGWVTVLEGVSGFGSPPALVAPILIRMGVSQELAMLLPLYGNVLAVPFGAMSTPLIIGFPSFKFGFLGQQVSLLSAALNFTTFIGIWVLIRGWKLPESKSEWFWLMRGFMGATMGMIFGGMFALQWSAAVSGMFALLFWIPWTRLNDVFDRKILFLVEMTSFLMLGQIGFRGMAIAGFRISNPGFWVAVGSIWLALRSGKKIDFFRKILSESFFKLKKPFIVTTTMTLFILYLTSWMQMNVAYFSIGSIQSLWLGFIAPGLAGTSTLGNLWVSSAFLTQAQISQAAWVAIGSGFGTLISFQILTAVATTVGLKKIPLTVWKKSFALGAGSLAVITLGLIVSELLKFS
ncbi:MAG: L-lactate permease [Xanthomonadaceae bacterium]|nr:L-lactate permease [Xanthomonadaceae bacterium]